MSWGTLGGVPAAGFAGAVVGAAAGLVGSAGLGGAGVGLAGAGGVVGVAAGAAGLAGSAGFVGAAAGLAGSAGFVGAAAGLVGSAAGFATVGAGFAVGVGAGPAQAATATTRSRPSANAPMKYHFAFTLFSLFPSYSLSSSGLTLFGLPVPAALPLQAHQVGKYPLFCRLNISRSCRPVLSMQITQTQATVSLFYPLSPLFTSQCLVDRAPIHANEGPKVRSQVTQIAKPLPPNGSRRDAPIHFCVAPQSVSREAVKRQIGKAPLPSGTTS